MLESTIEAISSLFWMLAFIVLTLVLAVLGAFLGLFAFKLLMIALIIGAGAIAVTIAGALVVILVAQWDRVRDRFAAHEKAHA